MSVTVRQIRHLLPSSHIPYYRVTCANWSEEWKTDVLPPGLSCYPKRERGRERQRRWQGGMMRCLWGVRSPRREGPLAETKRKTHAPTTTNLYMCHVCMDVMQPVRMLSVIGAIAGAWAAFVLTFSMVSPANCKLVISKLRLSPLPCSGSHISWGFTTEVGQSSVYAYPWRSPRGSISSLGSS